MVVAKVLTCQEVRTVSEDDVVLGEAFFDGGGRGYDNNWARPEAEGEYGTILFRKSL